MSCIMFARWFGIVSVLLAFGVLCNLDDAKEMTREFAEDATSYIFAGVLPIIFGSLSFIHHNSFTLGWNLVVSVIGLLMVLAGVFRVLFVRNWQRIVGANSDKIPVLFSLFGLIIGMLLLYVGFFAQLVR